MQTDIWEEMKQAQIGQVTVTTSATSAQLVARSDMRIALLISCPKTNDAWLSWSGAAADQVGVLLKAGGAPLKLSMLEHGRLCSGPINVITPAGGDAITYVESLHPCGCLGVPAGGKAR